HAEASARGTRRVSAGDAGPHEARRAGLYTALVNAPRGLFWWQYVRLLCGTVLRAVALVVVKDLAAARNELGALARVYGAPRQLARSRRARTQPADRRRIRQLLSPPWLPYVRGLETAATTVRAA